MLNEILKDALNRQQDCNDDYEVALDAAKKMIHYSDVARKEGLLALEDNVCAIVKDADPDFKGYKMYLCKKLTGLDRLLVSLFTLVVDGTDPDIIEEIAMSRYYMSRFCGAEAIAAYIIIKGALMIYAGENPYTIEEMLISLLPEDMQNKYADEKYENNMEINEEETVTDIPESFFEDAPKALQKGSLAEVTCKTILSCSNRCIQWILKDVNQSVLSTALLGMDGDTRRAIFDNISSHHQREIYNDMMKKQSYAGLDKLFWEEDIGDAQKSSSTQELEIEGAMIKLLNVIDELEEQCEIIFSISELDRAERKRAMAIH